MEQVEVEAKPREQPVVADIAAEGTQGLAQVSALDNRDERQDSPEGLVINDAEIAAEAVKDAPLSNSTSELDRLRSLVFASRGSKASLPSGWDDKEGGIEKRAEEVKGEEGQEGEGKQKKEAPRMNDVSSSDGIAQKMLQRAIDLVGQLSSDGDTDSDSDSSSSDSSSAVSTSSSPSKSASRKKSQEQEQQQKKQKRRAGFTATRGVDSEEEEDDDGGKVGMTGPVTKNEVLEPTVDVPPYSIVPADSQIRPLGRIHSIVDCIVVVAQDVGKAPGSTSTTNQSAASPSAYQGRPAPVDMHGRKGEEEGEYSVLDTGSLLAFPDRNVLGVVFETFGSVLSPLYALRYPSAAHVNKDLIQIGKPVCYVPSNSTYVLTRALRALGKGSDASNLYDEEVGDEEQEFSDDEAEAAYKRNAKAARGGKNNKKRNNGEEQMGRPSTAATAGPPAQKVKHGLPARPSHVAKDVPMHRDAASNQQSHQLYYDEEPVPLPSSSNPYYHQTHAQQPLHQAPQYPSAPPPQSAYAQWLQLQQQQAQHLPQFNQQPAQVAYPDQQAGYNAYYPSHSIPQAPPSKNTETSSYDPQQPHFNLPAQRPPHWQ